MSSKEEIILVGGGGHCKACIDVIEQEGRFVIKGIIDKPNKIGQVILGYPIIDTDKNLNSIVDKYKNFLITIGFTKKTEIRNKLFNKIRSFGGKFPIITSPIAYVSKHSIIGPGTIIMHMVIINADTKIGDNCIINNKALIEHDTVINDNVHIATGAIINGNCIVNKNCLIGSSAVLIQSLKIHQDSVIGAGSIIINDIIASGVYVGCPAKKIR